MGKFQVVSSVDIRDALNKMHRQYLTGKLNLPQIIKQVIDENIEVGISAYKEYAHELPHYHDEVSEYQYMLDGMTEYLDLDTKEVHRFVKGDFYVIRPFTKYAQRIKQGTEILFFKYPGKNDKIAIDSDKDTLAWLSKPLRVSRMDFNDQDAPPLANRIVPAVSVAILNDENCILMLRRKDSGNWTIPGGTLEFGEDLKSCGKREVKEETGLNVEIKDLVGTYTNPNNVVAYDDGEVRQEFTIMYIGEIEEVISNITIDDESTESKWVAQDQILDLPMAKSQKTRVLDLLHFLKSGERAYR